MTDLTGIAGAALGMALFALDHLHGGLSVTGQPVYINRRILFLLTHITMTSNTVQISVRGMRKVYVVRLPGVNQPRNGFILLNVLLHENPFSLGVPHHFLMALPAIVYIGDTRISAVIPEIMTILAIIILMGYVRKVQRLIMPGIQDVRKNHPADYQRTDKADQKRNKHYNARTLLLIICHNDLPLLVNNSL